MKTKIARYSLKCQRCGKEWVPRKEEIRQCPQCKTAYWDVPKEVRK